jgi:hypothetical protein
MISRTHALARTSPRAVYGLEILKLTQSADEQLRLRACQWWTARRMGWKETSVTENVGKDGGPIETRDVSAIDVIREQIASATERLEDKSEVA